jgi:hypothetical protein
LLLAVVIREREELLEIIQEELVEAQMVIVVGAGLAGGILLL